METEAQATLAKVRAASVGRWLCLAGAMIGAFALLEAIAGTGLLTLLIPGDLPPTATTALALFLLGAAGVLRDRQDAGAVPRTLSLLAALAVLAIGLVIIVQRAVDVDLHHLERLLTGTSEASASRGRPTLMTALGLTCLAGALVLFDFRATARARPSEWLILTGGLIGLTALLGFVFGAELRHRLIRPPFIGTSLPIAVGLLMISAGLLLERPGAGVMCLATSVGPGGKQFRRLVLPAILVPIVVGLMVAFPLRGVGGAALSVALAVVAAAMAMIGLLVLLGMAVSLNRTYEALEASRQRAQALVEQAPDGVFVADVTGRYIDVNSAGCRMIGYARDEVVGKMIVDLVAPEDAARVPQTRDQLLKGNTEVSEWTLQCKDGSRLPVEVSAKIFPDGRWQGLVRDISDRKRLEGDLRAAEAEQKFLADFGSALMSTIDDRETVEVIATRIARGLADVCVVETVEEGQQPRRVVVHRDPAAAVVVPRLAQLNRPRSPQDLGAAVIESKQPLLVQDATPAHLDQIAHNEEHRRLLRELGPSSLMALPLLAHGGVFGSLLIVSTNATRRYTRRDLSLAQKVATRAALAIEKARLYRIAQEAVRLREDVLNIVAHDLRNPLGTILLQAAMLRRGGGGGGPDRQQRKPADVIERSAIRMNHLIQDLLDVARMEGGRLSIAQASVPAGLLISDAVQAQEPRAASASLELRLEAESQLPELWADRDRVLQVFENLIGNAIKFTKAGGLITVGAARTDGHVMFWVADTGCGIAADDLPHVFERLWQGNKSGQQGAGLGLPIVKGIVEAHGGRVWVESKPGEGSIFFFTIPMAHGVGARQPEPPAAYG